MPLRKSDPRRYCQCCKARLRRKVFASGRLEDMGVFTRRKYCDQLCMAQGMVKESVGKAQHHHRARKHKKPACERCGSVSNLHVHHKDEDYTNDDPENLETVCATCHGKEHGPKRGNTFAGRQWLLKTDLAEIWGILHLAVQSNPNTTLSERSQMALHKHGQL